MASVPALGVDELVAFGEAAQHSTQWCVDVGGFLVPGEEQITETIPGKESAPDGSAGKGTREEAGPAAGSWQGRRTPWSEATTDSATHALGTLRADWHGNGITADEFDELEAFYPDVRVTFSSSRSIFLTITAGLFPSLEYRAQIVMEVPRPEAASRSWPLVRLVEWPTPETSGSLRWKASSFTINRPPIVPPVRTWARWLGGTLHGTTIISHHRYPDLSMCVCMPHQWIRGVDKLVDHASLSVSWIGKVIHEQELGFYPGPQHVREWVRVERDRSTEFCGCGERRRYAECCRHADRRLTLDNLRELQQETQTQYFQELSRQHRPLAPPAAAWA